MPLAVSVMETANNIMMHCFNNRVITLVAWLILVSEANCTREVVSLLFPTLFPIPE